MLGRGPVGVLEARTLGPQLDDLTVARKLHVARLTQERGRIRCEEHLVRADPDDERHLMACADEKPRMVVMDDDECEVALELVERAAHGLDEIAFVMALDEVRDGLGVGLGGERVSVVDEARGELAVVLDDPVQDDRQLRRITAGERVRVRLRDRAVCRPTRVAEPRGRRRAVRAGAGLQIAERPDGANVVEPVRLEQRDARRVVAAVLEALETLKEKGFALTRSDVSDDSAHAKVSLEMRKSPAAPSVGLNRAHVPRARRC